MYGRYGSDSLNTAIMILWLVLAVINLFLHSLILYIIYSLLCILFIFRMFSRNTVARRRENDKFLSVFGRFTGHVKTKKARAADSEHKYIKCKSCGATLRVKNQPGKHTVKCPKCGGSFETRIF